MRKLAKALRKRSWILYLDNLKVHTCPRAHSLYKELQIEVLFSPTYEPQLNAIEFFFSWLKREVKKERLQDMAKRKRRQYSEIIPLVVAKIKKEKVDNCIMHVFKLYDINLN